MAVKVGRADEAKWWLVCVPLAVFLVVTAVTFWSMAAIPHQRVLVHQVSQQAAGQDVDCDACVVVYTGDDGSTKPNETNLPFQLVRRLFDTVNMIQTSKLANRDKVVCVAVDHPTIPCRMARDDLGPNVNCWNFDHMRTQVPMPVRCDLMVVGNTSRYLQQFNNQTMSAFTWQRMEVVDLDSAATLEPTLERVRPTVVTGFSANHLTLGLLLLRSIAKAASEARETNPEFAVSVVIWKLDEFLGRDEEDLECVVKETAKQGVDVEVRRFKFWTFPEWMRLKQKQETGSFDNFGTGEYAWKVIMIHTVLVERGLVLWTDAGDRFKTKEALTETLDYISEHGFAGRLSGNGIGKWTHKDTLLYLRATHLNMFSPNCDGSAVGFTLAKYDELVRPWYDCALTRQCIAPDGSNRTNHRQDQAALTVLTYLSGNNCSVGVHGDVGKQMDRQMRDIRGAANTSCYSDPRQ